MSTAESTRGILFELRVSMGTLELGYGSCMVVSNGSDTCLPLECGLLNMACGYC
jgi:hypothetical protein